jgi:hypothetical protein
MKDELLKHTCVSTCMMPYITSQFMPRRIKDRPLIVPEGCTNLGFIGQFVEVKEDAVLCGNPAEEIIIFADTRHCDLIIMASHGWHANRLIHGSVAQKVLKGAQVPIMMIRAQSSESNSEINS